MSPTTIPAPSPARTAVPRRNPWFLGAARAYARYRTARDLDGVHVAGLNALQRALQDGPVILAVTHVSWWDTFIMVALDATLDANTSCPMHARNLARLPFFRHLGAFGIRTDTEAGRRAALDAAQQRLAGPGDLLIIFPQGSQRPSHLRPLGLQPGAVALARRTGAALLPGALSYLWREAPQPAATLHIGAPLSSPDLPTLESRLCEGLDANDVWATTGRGDYLPVIHTRGARPDATLWSRWLGALTGRGAQP